MSHVSYQTALALKEYGLPQPLPQPSQFWYGKRNAGFDAEPGSLCVLIGTETGNLEFVSVDGMKNDNNKFFVFAPTLEYITALLPIPELFHFEIWNNKPSCRFLDDENPRRTFGETFAEAAAKMYLELKQNAPNPDVSEPGDAGR